MGVVASSLAVPHVPSTSVRLTVPADLADMVTTWSAEHTLSRDEGVEVLLRSVLADQDSTARRVFLSYDSGDVQTAKAIEDTLRQAEVADPVIGIRLPARRATDEPAPYPRHHVGADLDDDPLTVWPAVRGLWRIHPRWTHVVAYRLGRPLALYRITTWEQDPESGRRWAAAGHIIAGDRRLNPDTGADTGAATSTDRAIADAVFTRPLATAANAANPLVLLNSR